MSKMYGMKGYFHSEAEEKVTSNYDNAKLAHAEEGYTGEKNNVEVQKRGYITETELFDERSRYNRERQSHVVRQNGPAS